MFPCSSRVFLHVFNCTIKKLCILQSKEIRVIYYLCVMFCNPSDFCFVFRVTFAHVIALFNRTNKNPNEVSYNNKQYHFTMLLKFSSSMLIQLVLNKKHTCVHMCKFIICLQKMIKTWLIHTNFFALNVIKNYPMKIISYYLMMKSSMIIACS